MSFRPEEEPAPLAAPLDPADPRFGGGDLPPGEHPRRLVRTSGPGSSPENPTARILRAAVPLLFVAGLVGIGVVFWVGLSPGGGFQEVGEEEAVRAALADRPRRVCWQDEQPCAWLTVVDDRLLALRTSGPLREEFGRQGVGWCPSSGYFGANATGSRFDAAGHHVSGPAPRGLDRYHLHVDDDGIVRIDFSGLSAGRRVGRPVDLVPPTGPDCEQIPFDRQPDLRIEAGSRATERQQAWISD